MCIAAYGRGNVRKYLIHSDFNIMKNKYKDFSPGSHPTASSLLGVLSFHWQVLLFCSALSEGVILALTEDILWSVLV